ncbi:MAG: glycosyltransferase family 4 protein [Thermosediminibacteraceae bacterium]|nr:glycosyltransferase family 4 protein [Thermosediminibacteraceae bacterium]
MKKILFIATVESHIINFHIPFIRYFQEKGFEVHVATKLGSRQNELKEIEVVCHNVDFERSPYSASNIKALRQLIAVMKNNKFSLVHVHTPVGGFLGRLAAKITNIRPVLYTAHGFHFYKGAPLKNWLIYYNMERLAARWTDGLITMNEEDYEAAKNLPLRNKNGVYKVHGVGVDLKRYFREGHVRKQVRYELGLKDDDICILTVAELIPNKNHLQLINAIEKVTQNSNIFCFFAGDGELKEKLKKYVKEKKMEHSIKFLGFRRDIPELLAASDIFCLMSLREGLPRCIMEAMAAGKPVIATDVRGNRDLVQNGVNGILVPVNDVEATAKAIESLSCEEKLRQRMGKEGRRIIEDFSLEKVLMEMDEIYKIYLS